MTADFSGYATKNDLKCSDGRTIKAGAFKHNDAITVPLVWQHQHNSVDNVLGHAVLENRADGVYAYGYFNDTPQGQNAKSLVEHKDVKALSIYANGLVQQGDNVLHGNIREVSLVLSGANPGAIIDNINLQHGDSVETLDDEAIIYTDSPLEHEDAPDEQTITGSEAQHADTSGGNVATEAKKDEKTVKDVFDTLNDEQKDVVYYLIGEAAGDNSDSAAHSDDGEDDEASDEEKAAAHTAVVGEIAADVIKHIQEDSSMTTRNVFEQAGADNKAPRATLTHSQLETIIKDGQKLGSFKESLLAHATEYGIEDIELLFPDAKAVSSTPELLARRTEWVAKVIDGTKHSPFAKIKSLTADITAEEARAKGYIKGNQKKDEVIKMLRRTTGPTTVYKKQKLDRDDILDITEIDIISWLKAEMRLMLEEEIARAILVGDGRSSLDEDKVKDPEGSVDGTGIRSIVNDNELYVEKSVLEANIAPKDAVKAIVRARTKYRGTGKPTLFISDNFLTDMMLEEDKFGRALYETEQALADKLRVSDIVTVDLLDEDNELLAILVNLADYTIGANRGGEMTTFEDFDIDFNQQKYLLETRISGALTKPKSAVVIVRQEGTLATATAPSFNGETNTITIPTATGVQYEIDGDVVTGSVTIDEDTEVEAHPKDGYYLASNSTKSWTYTYTE